MSSNTLPRNPSSRLHWLLLLVVVLVLPGCATRNVISDGADTQLMLRGNDPVAYHTAGKPMRGDPAIKAEHEGLTYRFVSDESRRTFLTSPARYAPAFGGYCASGAHYGLKSNIGAEVFKIVDGRLYLFGSERSRRHWELDQAENIRMGNWYWENETRDRPYRPQNFFRYIIRVPHYKIDAELEVEYQRRYGAGGKPKS